jgi:RNA polymerase sigma-70 factor (ECF subfamily)
MFTVTETCVDPSGQEARELARGLRKRDPDTLDRLIERFQYRLFRYLIYLSGSRETAEDLFQETWMRIVEKGHLYDGRSKFETWLFAIARNLFIDLVRSKRMPMSLEQLMEAEDGQASIPVSQAPLPSEQIAFQEQSRRLAVALGSLPAVHREVLVLRFQEDLALEEIAAITATPLSTVKSRVYRGLERLRQVLEEGKP